MTKNMRTIRLPICDARTIASGFVAKVGARALQIRLVACLSFISMFSMAATDPELPWIPGKPTLKQAKSIVAPRNLGQASSPSQASALNTPVHPSEVRSYQGPDPSKTVFFEFGSAQLSDDARRTLQAIATLLRMNRRSVVTLVGNTDDLGSKEYCISVSSKRTDAVEAELQSLGVHQNQIRKQPRGYETAAEYACDTEVCRHNRRRVDIELDD